MFPAKKLLLMVFFSFANILSALDMGLGYGARIDISPGGTGTLSSIASCAYFDATYVQLIVGHRLQNLRSQEEVDAAVGVYKLDESIVTTPSQSLTWIDLALLAKYPVTVGKFVFHPLVGVEFSPNLTYKNDGGDSLKDAYSPADKRYLNLLYVDVGIGIGYIASYDQNAGVEWRIRIELLGKYNPVLGYFVISANLLYGCVFK